MKRKRVGKSSAPNPEIGLGSNKINFWRDAGFIPISGKSSIQKLKYSNC